jgi:putative transposase
MANPKHRLLITRQCQLLSLNRSMFYYQPKAVSEEDGKLMRRIDEMHLKRPYLR